MNNLSAYDFVNAMIESWEDFDGDDVSTFMAIWAEMLKGSTFV